MNKLSIFKAAFASEKKFEDLRVGWTVKIHQKLKEKEKAKSQTFEGMIIAKKHGGEAGGTITVRKMSGGIGVEKILPLNLPSIEKIEVLKRPRVSRAKLYYLREKSSKEIRKKTKQETVAKATKTDAISIETPASS
ncbi:MAG: 50S ribosomal protein L19 [Patescibacteria group bacterium]